MKIPETFPPRVDERRFEALMESSYKKVYNLAYRLSGNRNDAEDLTQEAFFRAYRSFPDYEGDRPFENWILRITSRLFLDLVRHRRRRVRTVSFDSPIQPDGSDDTVTLEIGDRSNSPDAMLLQSELSEPLEEALSKLSPDQRLLVMLADVEGVPYKEIAEMLGTPIGTIRSRLHRAHKRIRMALETITAGTNSIFKSI